jgi:hypothetical protein
MAAAHAASQLWLRDATEKFDMIERKPAKHCPDIRLQCAYNRKLFVWMIYTGKGI